MVSEAYALYDRLSKIFDIAYDRYGAGDCQTAYMLRLVKRASARWVRRIDKGAW